MPFTIPNHDVSFNDNQSIWFDTDIAILAAGLAGVGVVSGCGVTAQGSPTMVVSVASGVLAAEDGVRVYVTGDDLTVDTADADDPRLDLITADEDGVPTYTAGVAAADPLPPDLPAGHIGLAFVFVPPADTDIDPNQITDKRAFVREALRMSAKVFAYQNFV